MHLQENLTEIPRFYVSKRAVDETGRLSSAAKPSCANVKRYHTSRSMPTEGSDQETES